MLVTGGSGRIGRAVVDLALQRDHQVTSLDRVAWDDAPSGVRYVTADMADYAAVEAAIDGCDAVVHLAAIPSPHGFPDHVVHNNNVVGSYNALCGGRKTWHQARVPGVKRQCHRRIATAAGRATIISRSTRSIPPTTKTPIALSKWSRTAGRLVRAALRRHDHRQPALSLGHAGTPFRVRRRSDAGNRPGRATCGGTPAWKRQRARAWTRSTPASAATKCSISSRQIR